jgi:hypothetical protein
MIFLVCLGTNINICISAYQLSKPYLYYYYYYLKPYCLLSGLELANWTSWRHLSVIFGGMA